MESVDRSIVIENGSSRCKCGYSGNDNPYIFPSVVGTPKYPNIFVGMHPDSDHTFIGESAIQKRGVLQLKFPVERGVVVDYEAMKLIWQKCYKNEHIDSESTQVKAFLAQSIFQPNSALCQDKAHREKKTQIFFQEFDVPAFYLSNSTKLALYSIGRTSGISVHSGDQVTQYVACHDGNIVDNGILDAFVAGKDITKYLKSRLLDDLKIDLSSSAELQIVKNIKQKACYVSLDPEKDRKCTIFTNIEYKHSAAPNDSNNKAIEFKLPDQNTICLNTQTFQCPEIMFKPKIIGQDTLGMHQNIIEIANRVEQSEIQKIMFSNIVVTGGNTMFKNIAERVTNQVKELTPYKGIVKVFAPLEREVSTWIGGSILTSLTTFQNMWITKAEYEEFGPNIVHKKCSL